MKIILSRKGFDSKYGKMPSPILPDGTLLSLPIPIENDIWNYNNLVYDNRTYFEIIKQLKPGAKIENQPCHLDPDIRRDTIQREKAWKPVFGQSDAALTHLRNRGVTVGDIFLFFGWFKQTEWVNGRLRYIPGSADLHVIYGYLQVGKIYNNGDALPDHVKYHTHAKKEYQDRKLNCMYVASEQLSLNKKLKGAGTLQFNPKLVLTKPGKSRSKWELPSFFRELDISYHSKTSFAENYFKSAAIGQEFVIDGNDALIDWVHMLIKKTPGDE